ncbi:MAG: choice-of-anchor tandem repeat GloVer-containing protein [Candidatus Cybelea sp.]|jgi:uncharacterized repeat protein (TIGR03803 family)
MTLSYAFRSLGAGLLVALLCGCAANLSHSALPVPGAPAGSLDWRLRPPASGLQDIYNFEGSPDGQQPEASITFQGKIDIGLTTTTRGGDSNNDGTVVQFRRKQPGKWTESVLYTFKGASYGDGSEPVGIQKEWDGTSPIFLSAAAGGASNNGALVGLTPTSSGPWTESFIYSFGGTPDGATPWGGVVADKAGNLYGTTEAGGTNSTGTVYRMQPKVSSYTESVLYSFQGGTDGDGPLGALIIDKKGALYGTTESGGSAGYGTVFKLAPSGSGYTESILHSFLGYSDGLRPESGLIAHTATDFYGTTVYGGVNNDGTVYRLTSSGSGYKVLWNFGSVSGDGVDPTGGLCVSKKGVIYGTTLGGGAAGSSGLGTFFTLTPSGGTYKESVYSFTGANGAYPFAGPSVDTKGHLYVTTEAGGTKNDGAVALFNGLPGCN